MNSTLIKTSISTTQKLLQNQFPASKYLTVPEMIANLQVNKSNFIVQICKRTPQLFNRSVWVGNRVGPMSTWLSTLNYQLPYKNFYLFIDKHTVEDQGFYQYFDNFFQRNAYKNYLGLCVGSRSEAGHEKTHTVQSVNSTNILQTIESHPNTLIIDVRGPQQALLNPLQNLPPSAQYQNIPLDHDQLSQKFQQTISKKDSRTQIITICAKGYRGTIAYSMFRHLMWNKDMNVYVCESGVEDVNAVFKLAKEGKLGGRRMVCGVGH